MATEGLYGWYNVSSITRQPSPPSPSQGDTTHLLGPRLNLTGDDVTGLAGTSSSSSSNSVSVNMAFPPGLDPQAYGDHVAFFPYPGDVQRLLLPQVREPNFVALVVVHALAFLLGIVGNGLVVAVLGWGRPGRCVTFPCLLSMAMADILFLLVCVPHEIVGYFLTHWQLSALLCKLSGFVEMVCALAAVLNLILISVERIHLVGKPDNELVNSEGGTDHMPHGMYFVIAHPLLSKSLCTARKARVALIATWVSALVLSTPAFVVMDTEVNVYYNSTSHGEMVICGDFGLDEAGRLAWAAWQLALLFVLPALVLFFCYTWVILILWLSTRQLQHMTGSRYSSGSSHRNGPRDRPGGGWKVGGADRSLLTASCSSHSQSTHSRSPGEEALQARKQVIRMLVVIIVVFLVCWGPHLVINLTKRLKISIYTPGTYHVWVMFACLPYMQSVINPVIYVLMSKKIRDAIISTPCVRCVLACWSQQVKRSPTHELVTATHSAATGMKTSVDTMRSYGASELTDV